MKLKALIGTSAVSTVEDGEGQLRDEATLLWSFTYMHPWANRIDEGKEGGRDGRTDGRRMGKPVETRMDGGQTDWQIERRIGGWTNGLTRERNSG